MVIFSFRQTGKLGTLSISTLTNLHGDVLLDSVVLHGVLLVEHGAEDLPPVIELQDSDALAGPIAECPILSVQDRHVPRFLRVEEDDLARFALFFLFLSSLEYKIDLF